MSSFCLHDRPIFSIGWVSDYGYDVLEVGNSDGITKIDTYEQFLGEYSIVWFQIWVEDSMIARFNARNVDSVRYFEHKDEDESEDETN